MRLNDEKQKPEVLNMLSARGIETVILFLEALTETLFLVNGIFFLFLVSRFKLRVYISFEDDNRLINENEVQRFQYIDDMDI